MARLTEDDIREQRTAFEQWQSPADMLARYRLVSERMDGTDFFNQPGIAFLREGWAAAKFGQARGAQRVRLVPTDAQWPDFEMQVNGKHESWELTEADVPGRRRGYEYREMEKRVAAGAPKARDDPVENWIERAEKVPEAIRSRCLAKATKRYGGQAALLVYLNISEYGIRQEEIENCFSIETAPAKDAFCEVWILWNDCAYSVWKDGQPAFRKFGNDDIH